jgi:hypothetical protein
MESHILKRIGSCYSLISIGCFFRCCGIFINRHVGVSPANMGIARRIALSECRLHSCEARAIIRLKISAAVYLRAVSGPSATFSLLCTTTLPAPISSVSLQAGLLRPTTYHLVRIEQQSRIQDVPSSNQWSVLSSIVDLYSDATRLRTRQ